MSILLTPNSCLSSVFKLTYDIQTLISTAEALYLNILQNSRYKALLYKAVLVSLYSAGLDISLN